MTTTAPAVSPAKVNFYLVLTTLLWGGSFVFNKIAFREIPPVTFMFLRFALATAIMALWCLPRLRKLNLDIVVKGAKVGLALASANITFVLGVAGTTVSRAGFLNNLFVLLIPLICFLRWGERVSRWSILGILLAMIGLWQMASGGAAGFSRGDLLCTVCALFISVHIIMVSKVLHHEDVYLVTLVQFATVALVGALLCLCLPKAPFKIGVLSAEALLYCAVFPTVVCFTIQNTYQRYSTPTRAGLIYTLDPVWSMLGGMLILGERMSPREWLGCFFIFCAVILPLLIHLLQERRAPDYLAQREGSS
jgi:drug/metabolite transporter (DMT)-like permease